jgi:hypothetical protein
MSLEFLDSDIGVGYTESSGRVSQWDGIVFGAKRWAPGVTVLLLALVATGCARTVKFRPRSLAGSGSAMAKVELTYDRNNNLEVKLSNVPDPGSVKPGSTRYVLWAATPDRQHVMNIGQLRVDEKKKAAIRTLTPLRSFTLFITLESSGDAMTPGPDVVFEAPPASW